VPAVESDQTIAGLHFFEVHMRNTRLKGFTLVELLVVIGIIALLISVLLPALNSARASAASVACQSQLRQVGIGLQLYANAYNNWFPNYTMAGSWDNAAEAMAEAKGPLDWQLYLYPYVTKPEATGTNYGVWHCPSDQEYPPDGIYTYRNVKSYGGNTHLNDFYVSANFHYRKRNKVKRSVETITALDANYENYGAAINKWRGGLGLWPSFRHGSKKNATANILYVDGHVGVMNKKELITPDQVATFQRAMYDLD
jgi:prepilin-type N-terminal cleavage/methylation domain-containing protein/prepilin-type processing-associated H-X9-DG protein